MGWAIIDETENGITMETIVYHYAYNKRLIRDMEEEIAFNPYKRGGYNNSLNTLKHELKTLTAKYKIERNTCYPENLSHLHREYKLIVSMAEFDACVQGKCTHSTVVFAEVLGDLCIKPVFKDGTYHHFNTPPVSGRVNPKDNDKSGMVEVCSPDIKPSLSPKVNAIHEYVTERRITNLIHFTRYENIEGIVKNGLVVRSKLDALSEKVYVNDNLRLEGHKETLSLSISFPNHKMFYKYRISTSCRGWAVITVNPSILWEYECAFCKNNAADARIRSKTKIELESINSLKEMFIEDSNNQGVRQEERMRQFDTTDPQAEILVFQNIPMAKILEFNFENQRLFTEFQKKHPHLNAKLNGTYFHSRSYVR